MFTGAYPKAARGSLDGDGPGGCDARGPAAHGSRAHDVLTKKVDGSSRGTGSDSDRDPSPYVDAETGFLRNEVSATTQEEIDLASAELLPGRLEDLAKVPIPCTGDKAHLQAIHRVLFDGIFDWAGQFRTTTDIDKQGTDFVPALEVEGALDQLFAELAAENLLRGLPRAQFVDRLAHYYARLNQIHPFREGNGRTQRLFWGQVALHAGWYVDFVRMSKEANTRPVAWRARRGTLRRSSRSWTRSPVLPRAWNRVRRTSDLSPAQAVRAALPRLAAVPRQPRPAHVAQGATTRGWRALPGPPRGSGRVADRRCRRSRRGPALGAGRPRGRPGHRHHP